MGSRQKPTILMVFLPSGFWANVLVGDDLSEMKVPQKQCTHAEKPDFRQLPPTTANFNKWDGADEADRNTIKSGDTKMTLKIFFMSFLELR